jgi:hypothetical protein
VRVLDRHHDLRLERRRAARPKNCARPKARLKSGGALRSQRLAVHAERLRLAAGEGALGRMARGAADAAVGREDRVEEELPPEPQARERERRRRDGRDLVGEAEAAAAVELLFVQLIARQQGLRRFLSQQRQRERQRRDAQRAACDRSGVERGDEREDLGEQRSLKSVSGGRRPAGDEARRRPGAARRRTPRSPRPAPTRPRSRAAAASAAASRAAAARACRSRSPARRPT